MASSSIGGLAASSWSLVQHRRPHPGRPRPALAASSSVGGLTLDGLSVVPPLYNRGRCDLFTKGLVSVRSVLYDFLVFEDEFLSVSFEKSSCCIKHMGKDHE